MSLNHHCKQHILCMLTMPSGLPDQCCAIKPFSNTHTEWVNSTLKLQFGIMVCIRDIGQDLSVVLHKTITAVVALSGFLCSKVHTNIFNFTQWKKVIYLLYCQIVQAGLVVSTEHLHASYPSLLCKQCLSVLCLFHRQSFDLI